MSDPHVVEHRVLHGNAAAIIFIHGFGGDPHSTWTSFPELLAADPALRNWDIFGLGYPSTLLLPDISSLWSAEPDIRTVSDVMATRAVLAPFKRYKALAFVAHSMGGLVVQRALVDREALANRVTHVLLYGTPSFGLVKAGRLRFWKRQARDMQVDSPFIKTVRSIWTERFARRDHFKFLAVAGDTDEFVPRISSLDGIPPPGFPIEQQMVVAGNHLQIVKPDGPDHLSVKVAKAFLIGEAAVYDSAFAAAERARFQAIVGQYRPDRPADGTLDDGALVKLALALEALGDQDGAIAVLEAHPNRGTDPTGVLAGRLKRRWVREGREDDAEEALMLYRQSFERSRAAHHFGQVSYHAINIAYMEWAYNDDRETARSFAAEAVKACAAAKDDYWRRATEGEAAIILGDHKAAMTGYGGALALNPSPREIDSMYQQASFELDLADNVPLAQELHALFVGRARGSVESVG